jgi:WD40 repeat protein
VLSVAVAPDCTWLATASGDHAVRVWDGATAAVRAIMKGHTGPVRSTAIAPDGGRLASVGDDHTVRVWAAATAAGVASMRVDGSLYGCVWKQDGTGIALAGAKGVYLFDYHSACEVHSAAV